MKLIVSSLCLCFVLRAADRPELSAADVVRSADHSVGPIAPGEIVVLFPHHAGPEILAGSRSDEEGKIATLLSGTRVWFDDIAAPVVYSVEGQVRAVVPYEVANKRTTQISIEYNGARSLPVTLPVVDSAPALFTLDSSGKGQAAMLNETGCCNSARNPAARGSVAVLYATGEGQTTPFGVTGNISAYLHVGDYPAPLGKVRVIVGGEPAEILFAAEAPHSVTGLLQVNFRIPAKTPIGDAVPIVLSVGNYRSPDGVTMAVRSDVQQILIVNNDAAMRDWLHKMLSDAGYGVVAARNSSEALAQAGGHPIDLIISALSIPEPEQLEMTDALRVSRPQLKIIATAAVLDDSSLRAADLIGAQFVLTRQMTPQKIVQRVRDLLRSRPMPYVTGQEAPPVGLNRTITR